jgi:hypothetical protein
MTKNIEIKQSPEEQAPRVLVLCGNCRRPVGKAFVPTSTVSKGAGKVSLGGMGLLAKERTVEGDDAGRVHYTCPGCGNKYVLDAVDVANRAITAASQHLRGFRLPSSQRGQKRQRT